MIYKDFQGKKISLLSFGTMRLPQGEDVEINQALTEKMVDYALENGVNYFDTAYPYMGGKSEISVGKALGRHPRDSFYLATKYPGHQFAEEYNPKEIFEEQLKKCNVEYFDFYLLHNVYDNCIDVYTDPKWGIIEYFKEQKKNGRIKHLGFSSHASIPVFKKFVEEYGKDMEFCQIQMNYVDWTLQDAKQKYEILEKAGIPVWIMEPVRGGKLANIPGTPVSSAFRWLQQFDNITTILSGMSNMEQMEDNIKTFEKPWLTTEEENKELMDLAERLKNAVPCTGCRYCCDGCPQSLDIPTLIGLYNDAKFQNSVTPSMQMDALPEEKLPSNCIGCGICSASCPQAIDIPKVMSELTEMREKTMPDWKAICIQRAEEAKQNKQ